MPTQATSTTDATAHKLPRRLGADLKTKIADSTLIQALIAGALSFTHIRDVAVMGGQTGARGWAYPFIVDLITMSAYRKLKHNQADDQPTGTPWTIMVVGTLFSLAANVIDALAHAPAHATPARLTLCVIIGVWPACAFFGSMLLRHSGKPTDQPTTVDHPAPVKPATQPSRPATRQRPAVQPANRAANTAPPPIPVRPTAQPTGQPPFIDLGPRAVSGELPLPVWVMIGHPIYEEIKASTRNRPTETALQSALGERVAELVSDGALPPAVGKPSLSTAKRIRRAVEEQHPELRARTGKPVLQLTAATP